MSDDIVKRLRAPDGRFLVAKLHNEAADEIERLRAERDEARGVTMLLLAVMPSDELERFASVTKDWGTPDFGSASELLRKADLP